MVQMFSSDPALLTRLKTAEDPIGVLRDTATKAETVVDLAYRTDKRLYRIAVKVLGALALLAAVGSIVLVFVGKNTPEVLVSLGSAAVGALVGLFAPPPTGK